MKPGDALRVTAHLSGTLAGDPPHLDSLLVYITSRLQGKPTDVDDGYKIDRRGPCPDSSSVAIPLYRETVADRSVARCTSPILPVPTSDIHEHFGKRLGVEYSGLLAPDCRRVVTTTNDWTKSHRLPIRTRRVRCVVWLCVGNRRGIMDLLKYLPAVGKKTKHGYGSVERWEVERLDFAPLRYWPWWITSESGPVLMRPMPADWDGLPKNLIGAKPDFGACSDPYWHPDRYGEIVVPC